MKDSTNQPYHIYKAHLARELQKKPYYWPGHCAWQIISKFEESIASFWSNGAPIDALAGTLHALYMELSKPKPFAYPTKESMEAVGCSFVDRGELR